MLMAMGRDLAAIHLGTANRRKAIAADLESRGSRWLGQEVEAAAAFVRREQKEYARSR
jgi:hypothetical protein